jgi:hypothetical protein
MRMRMRMRIATEFGASLSVFLDDSGAEVPTVPLGPGADSWVDVGACVYGITVPLLYG